MEFHTPRALLGSLIVDADADVMDTEEEEDLAGDLMYSKEVRGVEAEEYDILDRLKGYPMYE
jgi:hypothetical protein